MSQKVQGMTKVVGVALLAKIKIKREPAGLLKITARCTHSTVRADWGLLADAAFIALAAHNVSLAWDVLSWSNKIARRLSNLGIVPGALGITYAYEGKFREALVDGHHLLVCCYILGQFRSGLGDLQKRYKALPKAKRAEIEEELGVLLRGEFPSSETPLLRSELRTCV